MKWARGVALVLVLALMLTLTGCTMVFTVRGSSSYTVMTNGDVLNGELEKDTMKVDITVKGIKPTMPVVFEARLQGLIMSLWMEPSEIDDALNFSATYLRNELSFDSSNYDVASDTFWVDGSFTLMDFLDAIGLGVGSEAIGPIELSAIIGSTAYLNFINRIIFVSSNYTVPGSTIDYELSGQLKNLKGDVVGTLELWFLGLNPKK